MNTTLLRVLCCCFLLVFPSVGFAADAASAPGALEITDENAERQTWRLTADTLTNLDDGAVLEAEGDVLLQRGIEYLKADFARYYPESNWVYLRGNVEVRMGQDDIKATEAEFDLRSRTGWLKDGSIFMEGPHMYFVGTTLIKHRGDRYTFHDAKITACDGDVPAWSVVAQEATVEIDGYAHLYRAAFQVADTPVFASPYMIAPAKTTRQSGLLMPHYGRSNKLGLYYTQPYFHVIDESRDATVYATMMEKMGFMGSVQYRSQTTAEDKLWFMASGLSSKNVVRWPEDDPTGNNLARNNWNRYWLRGMTDGNVGESAWKYRADVDWVSDQNFLRQFGSGPVGFDASRNETFRLFGRDLREDDKKRLTTGILYKDWERVGVALSARYEQDATLGRGNRPFSQDETVQQMPKFDAFLYKGFILPELPLELEMHANSAYMYRREGTKGMRTEIYPRLSLPLEFGIASFIGTFGWRNTVYNSAAKSKTDPQTPNDASDTLSSQSGNYRSVPDLDLQLYTEASRVWNFAGGSMAADESNVGQSRLAALRHQIQPRLRYQMTPDIDQEDNPFYSLDDRIHATNELTYSITNVVTRKTATVVKLQDGPDDEPVYETRNSFADLVWWKVEAGYDFEEASRKKHRDLYSRKPAKDIYSELEFYPFAGYGGTDSFLSNFSYTNKLYLSPNDGDLTRYDHGVTFRLFANRLEWYTGLSYRTSEYEIRKRLQFDDPSDVIRETPLRLLNNRVTLNLNDTWSFYFDQYRNERTNSVYDERFSVTYTDQCYRLIGYLTKNETETSFSVGFELPGLFE